VGINFMEQSTLHAGIIMDGNGRWAQQRGLPRIFGHRAGASAVRRAVEAAPTLGVRVLTLFAFSSDNWKRPAEEVAALMELFQSHLESETPECLEKGVRMEVIGRRDRLSSSLNQCIQETQAVTGAGSRLHLRIAVDYSARDAIRRGEIGPDLDLLIRTGGEQRLSDFLLWESAYAELVFLRRLWPDFDGADFAAAVRQYHGRERRFGAVPLSASEPRRELWLE
jgi:undecaprenyl diphosphate synthase